MFVFCSVFVRFVRFRERPAVVVVAETAWEWEILDAGRPF
jgi:hypothetical protein